MTTNQQTNIHFNINIKIKLSNKIENKNKKKIAHHLKIIFFTSLIQLIFIET